MNARNRSRRGFLKSLGYGTVALSAAGSLSAAGAVATPDKPNIVLVFVDDMGYGDLACQGHPTIATPHLDRMAAEGQRWTNFYSASSVCTPSRAALMTGRLPIRSGMCSSTRRVLFPDSAGGLPASEITIAEALKTAGYETKCVGKWHLGHLEPYLPTRNGFDSYFGIPYSNDMDRVGKPGGSLEDQDNARADWWNVPLMRDEKIVERPADQNTLTKRYTEEAVGFIRKKRAADRPFFLYLAHGMPHIPLFRSKAFVDKSRRGLYGDVIEEIDWSVGAVLDALRDEGIEKNTLVFFTSDNGPWLIMKRHGGSAGLLREGKGCTWEGGMREPFIAWWPGKIRPGVVRDIGCTMDIFPTSLSLAGVSPPTDRVVDGMDLGRTLFEGRPSPRDEMLYYRGEELFAVRKGKFKAHFITQNAYGPDLKKTPHDPPLLYDLERDPSEAWDVAAKHPEVIAEIRRVAEEHQKTLRPVENQLIKRIPKEKD